MSWNILQLTWGDSGRDDEYGHGLINAIAAFDFLADGNTLSPTISPTVFSCQYGKKSFELKLATDSYPSETSWTLHSNYGEKVLEGYNRGVKTCIFDEDYYRFTILDSFGDGICCSYGSGWYKVFYDDGLVHHGGDFEYNETIFFGSSPTPSPSQLPSNFHSSHTVSSPVESPPILQNGDDETATLSKQKHEYLLDVIFPTLFSLLGMIIILFIIVLFKRKRKIRKVLNRPSSSGASNKKEVIHSNDTDSPTSQKEEVWRGFDPGKAEFDDFNNDKISGDVPKEIVFQIGI